MRLVVKTKSEKIEVIPIKVGIVFSLVTLFFYEFGVWDFPKINNYTLVAFVLICNIAMFWGFVLGSRRVKQPRMSIENNNYFGIRLFNVVFWVTLVLCIPKFMIFTGGNFSLSSISQGLIQAINNPLAAYQDKHMLASVSGVMRIFNYVIVLFGGLIWAYIPLSIIYWKVISFPQKLFSVFYFFLYAIQYLLVGTNTGIFNLVIEISMAIIIREIVMENKTVNRAKLRKLIFIAAAAFVIVVYAFSFIMNSRIGDQFILKTFSIASYKYSINTDNFMWQICPNGLKQTFANLTQYVTSGYTGLDLALSSELHFVPTFGMGFSRFICDNVSGLIGIDIYSYTYLGQIQKVFGYDALANWSTMYSWWASDVSFYGIPIVLFVLMFTFGDAWRVFLSSRNIYALLFFFLMVRFFLYITANNQIFMQYDTLGAFVIFFCLWKKSG